MVKLLVKINISKTHNYVYYIVYIYVYLFISKCIDIINYYICI